MACPRSVILPGPTKKALTQKQTLFGSTVLAAMLAATAPALAQTPQAPTSTPSSTPASPPAATAQSTGRTSVMPEPDILLEADELTSGESGNSVEASGNVVARASGRTINAQRITYDLVTGVVEAFGGVTLIEADGTSSFAESIKVEDDLASGIIRSFSARLANGAVIAADAAIRETPTRTRLSRVVYTACPLCEDGSPPTWAIRARRAVQDQDTATISYSDVVLEVLGQPVAYVPYFAHPDPNAKRQSGFLPTFPASNSRLGLHLQVPYLLVIDDHSDITFSPLIAQNANPVLEVSMRRAFYSGLFELGGSATYERLFGNDGDKSGDESFRGHAFGTGRFRLNETWQWGFGVENASDDTYLLRYGFDGEGDTRGPIRAESGRLVSQIYTEGQSSGFYARVLAAGIQDLVGGTRRQQTPNILPTAEARYLLPFGPLNGQVEATGNFIVLDRNDGLVDSARASGGVSWSGATIVGNGLVVSPSLLARADWFAYEGAGPSAKDRFTRAVGQASLDIRWPLERRFGSSVVELEPRLNLTLASDDSQAANVIVGDTAGYELDRLALFDSGGIAGQDQWQSGARVTAGLAAQWRQANGARTDGFIGVQWRDDDNTDFSRNTNLDRDVSDVIGEFATSHPDVGSIRLRLRYDPELGELARTEAWATIGFRNLSADFRYLYANEATFGPRYATEEWQAGLRYQISERWQVFGAGLYNQTDDNMLLGRLGLIYLDDCTELRMFYERSGITNRFVEPSEGFRIQIALRSFGRLSDSVYEPRW